jgi:hypothetical protein
MGKIYRLSAAAGPFVADISGYEKLLRRTFGGQQLGR